MSLAYLAPSLDRVAMHFPDASTLLSTLPLDAVLVRAAGGELIACVPRLVELAVGGDLEDPSSAFAPVAAGWGEYDEGQQGALTNLAIRWWESTLGVPPPISDASAVLACLAHLPVSLSQWEQMWLADLDEAPVAHLVRLISGGLDSPAWAGIPGKRDQVRGWTRSEPVLFGLTLVAGAHLGEGELAEVLDRLVGEET